MTRMIRTRHARPAVILALASVLGCSKAAEPKPISPTDGTDGAPQVVAAEPPAGPAPDGMVWVGGGSFDMGSPDARPDERPVHDTVVRGIWVDRHEVTNAQFAAFVDATGYVTIAERIPDPREFPGADPAMLVPGSLVFRAPDRPARSFYDWWDYLPGASWRCPEGGSSTIDDRLDHPVVHVSWEDAVAYAAWSGKRLPTEAEWEFAARGTLCCAKYPWGDQLQLDGSKQNAWDGPFPRENQLIDGYTGTAPVGSFPPNEYGLHDMAGNVWEWCADWYRPDYYANAPRVDPRGPEDSFDPDEPGVPKRVQRGGSYLCSENYCTGYRVSARMKSSPDTGLSHTGFRCVQDP